MTVAELSIELQKYPRDALVVDKHYCDILLEDIQYIKSLNNLQLGNKEK